MRKDAIDYIKKCGECQRDAPVSHQPAEHMHPIISPFPFMNWGMDIMGPLPRASGNRTYMLAMTDYFSKWIEAKAFPQILTTPKVATGQTPFSLVYGAEAVIPSEMHVPTHRYAKATEERNRVEMASSLDTFDEPRTNAQIKMTAYKQTTAGSYNKNVRLRTLQLGDLVLRKVFPNTKNQSTGKFAYNWEGPYCIDDIVGNGAYKLETMDGEAVPRSWNIIHLKKGTTPEPICWSHSSLFHEEQLIHQARSFVQYVRAKSPEFSRFIIVFGLNVDMEVSNVRMVKTEGFKHPDGQKAP
ncbi:uncharacterized protein LOC141620667 [Silene latifolia]|uniref:uncharacterized protein LOC141620667 n=1 Tax=Silene latifolia TaxID=37657 RepID=UPI003D77202F